MSPEPLWMEERIKNCSKENRREEQFILNHMGLTAFNTMTRSPNPRIEAILQFLRNKKLFVYIPAYLQILSKAIKSKIVEK